MLEKNASKVMVNDVSMADGLLKPGADRADLKAPTYRCECDFAKHGSGGCRVVLASKGRCYDCREDGDDGEPRYCDCPCAPCTGSEEVEPIQLGFKEIKLG
jgi:hypothetical protein